VLQSSKVARRAFEVSRENKVMANLIITDPPAPTPQTPPVTKYNRGMSKNAKTTPPATSANAEVKNPKAFTGIKRREITILKPGTVNPLETLRRMRGR
jgi:hypothetical protein